MWGRWAGGFSLIFSGFGILVGCGLLDVPPLPAESDAGADGAVEGGVVEAGLTPDASKSAWQAAGSLLGCTLERLTEPSTIRVFEWEPCETTPGCERARFSPKVLREGESNTTGTRIQAGADLMSDDGKVTRVTLQVDKYWGTDGIWFSTLWIADGDGQALDAFRPTDMKCRFHSGGLWGARFGMNLSAEDQPPFWLLHEVGSPEDPVLSELNWWVRFPSAMGTTRWAYGLGLRMASDSNTTAGDEHVFAHFNHYENQFAQGNLGGLTSAGDTFLYERQDFQPFVDPIEIYSSNGIEEGTPYLSPPNGSDYLSPVFAHTHVVWLRGLNHEPVSDAYEAIEIWASPFSTDANLLQPQKLGDTDMIHRTTVAGGWGRFAMAFVTGEELTGVEVWNVKTGLRTQFPTGTDGRLWKLLGLTQTHLWVLTDLDQDNAGDRMLRYVVE